MTFEILLQIVLFGIALSMDAFAVSVTDGLVYTDVDRKKSLFIACDFGVMQALMPLIGFWAVQGITALVGETAGEHAGNVMSEIVCWIAFALLIYIGISMLVEAVREIKKPAEQKEQKKFSAREVLVMGVATSIDALATGVAFHNKNAEGVALSTTSTIWLHSAIIMVCTFAISLLGVVFGKQFEKMMKGKYEVSGIVGGVILICLGIWTIVSHYVG